MPTLVILFSLITYICTIVIVSNYGYAKNNYPGIFEFAISYVLFSVAITFVLLSAYLAPTLRILASNILMYASLITFICAISRFYDKKFYGKIYLLLLFIFSILYVKFTIFSPNVNARIVIFDLFAAAGYLHMTIIGYNEVREYDTRRFSYISFISMIVYLIRIPIAIFSASIPSYIFSSHIDTIPLVAILLNLLLLTFGLLLLIQGRMNADIKKYDLKQKELLLKLQLRADTDDLTSLMNRRKIEEELAKVINLKQRYNQLSSIILIDIDYFKKVNDRYGHSVGDEVLVELSNLLIANLRKVDLLGRWGGEEFIIIMPNINLEEAFVVAENLRKKVLQINLPVFEVDTMISISSGVLELSNEINVKTVISKVDELLYKAKNGGRNLTVSA